MLSPARLRCCSGLGRPGRKEWDKILQSELEKAGDVRDESTALKLREIEQAVTATFLHSQPVGQKALTRELVVLPAATRPDKIELEKELKRRSGISWFPDEVCLEDAATGPNGEKLLPKSWRMGAKSKLRHRRPALGLCCRCTLYLAAAQGR